MSSTANGLIGRILLHPQALEGRPWFWAITARVPQSTHDRGYASIRASYPSIAMSDLPLRHQRSAFDELRGTSRFDLEVARGTIRKLEKTPY